jgi:hypothetical protein
MSIIDSVEYCSEQWRGWQADVVDLVRRELSKVSYSIHGDDFDWDAWRGYFEAGYLPVDTVKQALSLQATEGVIILSGEVTSVSGARMELQVD